MVQPPQAFCWTNNSFIPGSWQGDICNSTLKEKLISTSSENGRRANKTFFDPREKEGTVFSTSIVKILTWLKLSEKHWTKFFVVKFLQMLPWAAAINYQIRGAKDSQVACLAHTYMMLISRYSCSVCNQHMCRAPPTPLEVADWLYIWILWDHSNLIIVINDLATCWHGHQRKVRESLITLCAHAQQG